MHAQNKSINTIFFILWFLCFLVPLAANATTQHIFVSSDHILFEYDETGRLVQTKEIPATTGCCGQSRDLVSTEIGNIAIFNGTFDPSLSVFNPNENTWYEQKVPGWMTFNNIYYGGIAAIENTIYVTDMGSYNSTEKGIIAIHLDNHEISRYFTHQNYIDLALGHDGFLYALKNSYGQVDVINPVTMEIVNSLSLGHTLAIRSLAVNHNGIIYAASSYGDVYVFHANGVIHTSHSSGLNDLSDIDLEPNGRIVMGSRFGKLAITDEFFSEISYVDTGTGLNVFVAFGKPLPVQTIPATPWQTNASGYLATGDQFNFVWDYAMGYHFTPQKDGLITKLGGSFDGTKTIKLFDKNTGELLAETVATATTATFAYTQIDPIAVTAGTTYTVAVYLEGSGLSFRYGFEAFPQSFGDIVIEGSTYVYTGNDPYAQPVATDLFTMYGQADIEFIATQ